VKGERRKEKGKRGKEISSCRGIFQSLEMIKPEEHLTEPWDMFRVKLPSRKFLAHIRKLCASLN
jgi:hypothetical protein